MAPFDLVYVQLCYTRSESVLIEKFLHRVDGLSRLIDLRLKIVLRELCFKILSLWVVEELNCFEMFDVTMVLWS